MGDLCQLWPYPRNLELVGERAACDAVRLAGSSPYPGFKEDLETIGGLRIRDGVPCSIELFVDESEASREEYRLTIGEDGILISGVGKAGLMYGCQTLLQVLALYKGSGKWPLLAISDGPAYRKRSFMVDMGRSVFTVPLLKRIVRILARLKMNQLHLHLYDDELCGIRFEGLPFGTENPYSISVAELGELVSYAADYSVEIVPELESWGHVTSIVYHLPELRGGSGMYDDSSSFLICEEMFDLMKEMIRQVARVMPDEGIIHLGLDEAKWFPGPSMPDNYTPADMILRYYNIIQEIGLELNRRITMRIWADHGGRPVPKEIRDDIIIEPWQYWNANADLIDKQVESYSGEGKMRWMMGAGQSAGQYRGAYHATRHWCRKAIDSPNVEGVNLTFWGTNDIAGKLISLFAGSYFAWNPKSPEDKAQTEDYETFDSFAFPIMQWWQAHFSDASPDEIRRDDVPDVCCGRYLWNGRHGEPVAPTVLLTENLYWRNLAHEGRD